MFLALIEPGGYLNFATPMPFADKSGPPEQGILNQAGHISRRPQAAVRGLSQPVWPMKISFCRARISPSSIRLFAKREPPSFPMRRGKELLWSYRTLCAIACSCGSCYEPKTRCKVSGLKLINGGGRAEVVAAHIRPIDRRPFRTSPTARPIAARTCQNFPVFFAFSQDLQSDLQFICSGYLVPNSDQTQNIERTFTNCRQIAPPCARPRRFSPRASCRSAAPSGDRATDRPA